MCCSRRDCLTSGRVGIRQSLSAHRFVRSFGSLSPYYKYGSFAILTSSLRCIRLRATQFLCIVEIVKRFWVSCLFGLIAILIGFTPAASAQDVQNFEITNFEAEYFLDRNAEKTSVLNVIERIEAKFPDFDQNHGILRAIPETYQNHTTSLSVESIKNSQGQKRNYSTYHENDNLVLKIGDADKFVHGVQTYVIRYTLRNVINFQADHDEFYWDVNGDQWPQKFGLVSAKIHIPQSLAGATQSRQLCFAGTAGGTSQSSCAISREAVRNEIIIMAKTLQELEPYSTLTFVLGFDKGTFLLGPEITREKKVRDAKVAAATGAVTLPPAAALIFMYRRWRQFGDDPKGRGVIVPEYEPPKGLTALTSDYLMQQKLRNIAFSAAIIELATNRYLTIYEIKQKKRLRRDTTDYELELNKLPDNLPAELRRMVDTVFAVAAVGSKEKLSELKKSAMGGSLREDMKQLERSLAANLFRRGMFIKNPRKVRNGYLAWAGGLAIGATILLFTAWTAVIAAGIFLAAAVIFLFAFIMPARTEQGVVANDALLGLKDYIKLAEADRLKFGQSAEGAEKIEQGSFDPTNPKMKIKLFESLLPYAILFGLEKSWAKEFEGIYKEPPDWYHGNWAAFNTGYLAGSLSSFNAVSSQTFVSPSSSSGSGFSGGGTGGGGGGGGGW